MGKIELNSIADAKCYMRLNASILTVAVIGVLSLAAPAARANTSFQDLLNSGATNFGILGLAGLSNFDLSNVTINGNAGMDANGTLTNMAPSTITGNLYKDPTATYTGPGALDGSTTTQSMSTINAGALSAATDATNATASQTFTVINTATTISAVSTLTVIDISSGGINLNNNNLTLSGNASDFFIVDITGGISLTGTASLNLIGGLTDANVIYNMVGTTGCGVNTHVGDVINGILIDSNCGVGSSLDGAFNGELIFGGSGTATLLSNASVTQNATPPTTPSIPEPSSFVLRGSGAGLLFAFSLFRKKIKLAV